MWLLSRFEDVSAIATNPAMVRSLEGIAPPNELAERQRAANWHDMPYHERVVQFSLLDSDGPLHRRLRKLVFGSFTTAAIAHLETMIRQHVSHLLDNAEARDSFDFIEDFAMHIPGFVIGQFIGAPPQDSAQLRIWSEQVVQFFDVDRSDTKKTLAETATREFYHYLEALKRERQANPKDDLFSRMIADEAQGNYHSTDELISTCMLILMAGHGSTIDVLGSGMHTLLRERDALMTLSKAPQALPQAIQEMFRYDPPLPFFHRHALEPVQVAGQTFDTGTTFGLLYGAANRDESAFADADRYIHDRSPNRHLAFGQGAHLCLGNNLARLTMRVTFEEILSRFTSWELQEDFVPYKPGLSVRGPQKLPVCFGR